MAAVKEDEAGLVQGSTAMGGCDGEGDGTQQVQICHQEQGGSADGNITEETRGKGDSAKSTSWDSCRKARVIAIKVEGRGIR